MSDKFYVADELKHMQPDQMKRHVFRRFTDKDFLQAAYTWKGEYQSTPYEISFHRPAQANDGNGAWCYYLYLYEAQFGSEFESIWLEAKPSTLNNRTLYIYDEYNSPLGQLSWHGGITYYEKHQHVDSGARYVKVGCDYSHLFDHERGYPYFREYVEMETKDTAKELHQVFPCLLVRCSYSGEWVHKEDIVVFQSIEYPEREMQYSKQFASEASAKYWRLKEAA